jgi:MoxR-like ATPase
MPPSGTDLRGLPVPEGGIARWYPPEFLPRAGKGVLFLDELNLAAPAVQGVAQQLILDRRVGSYRLPEGWLVWAAGNRKEDRAAVYDMPGPLANRFVHLEVGPDLPSFLGYAARTDLAEKVIAFLSFRGDLLHKVDPHRPAWPSPRTWEMAGQLHLAGLPLSGAVGEGPAAEFQSFLEIYDSLPDLEAILQGEGAKLKLPSEPSKRYAVAVGLAARADTPPKALEAFRWVQEKAGPEWTQLYASQMITRLRERGKLGELAQLVDKDPVLKKFIAEALKALAA